MVLDVCRAGMSQPRNMGLGLGGNVSQEITSKTLERSWPGVCVLYFEFFFITLLLSDI